MNFINEDTSRAELDDFTPKVGDTSSTNFAGSNELIIFGKKYTFSFNLHTILIAIFIIIFLLIIVIFIWRRNKQSKKIEKFQNSILGYWTAPLSFCTRANLKMLSFFIGEKEEENDNFKAYLLMIDNDNLPVFNGFIKIKIDQELDTSKASPEDKECKCKKYKIHITSKEELPDGWDEQLTFEYFKDCSKIRIWREKVKKEKEILAIFYKDNEVSEIFNGN